MSVGEDESYVVNGFVVHNCKDYVLPVITDAPETVSMRLQAVMDDARVNEIPPSVNPAAADALTQTLLHSALALLVAQFRGQFTLPGF